MMDFVLESWVSTGIERTKLAWMTAHFHGWAMPSGWLYTSCGASDPMAPWLKWRDKQLSARRQTQSAPKASVRTTARGQGR